VKSLSDARLKAQQKTITEHMEAEWT